MNNITNDEYLVFTRTTVIYPKDKELEYLCLGIASETGEILGKVKKLIRDRKELTTNAKGEIIAELGDVAYYLTRLADHLGITLTDLLQSNYEKLSSRKERGVIGGNGDYR
jgi:NTP pyrophosphatase (non-canonical NTP hydrolase)